MKLIHLLILAIGLFLAGCSDQRSEPPGGAQKVGDFYYDETRSNVWNPASKKYEPVAAERGY